jgi:uncharacterized membrane protein
MGEPIDFMQENWSPTARLLAGLAGTSLMMNCLTRRSPVGLVLGTAGGALALRALTNQETKRLFGLGGRRGIDVQKTIVIDQPVEDVFEFLADPMNYPRITDLVKTVEDLGGDRYQKTLAGPGGSELKIEERITRYEPNHFIACRSEPNSSIQYAVRAWFEPVGESQTRVHIQATYNAPGGVLGHSAAWLTGLDLKSQLDDMLMRAKSYLETGRQPHDAAQRQGNRSQRPQESQAGS